MLRWEYYTLMQRTIEKRKFCIQTAQIFFELYSTHFLCSKFFHGVCVRRPSDGSIPKCEQVKSHAEVP